jgi:hypothetical protein
MCRHLVSLAAFLVEPDPPALAVGKIILDPRRHDGADAGEGVGHDADQGAVAQADEVEVSMLSIARGPGRS